jgi:tetratricopeptide (TPR) repeat protein
MERHDIKSHGDGELHPSEHYPQYWAWYRSKSDAEGLRPYERFAWDLMHALVSPRRDGIKEWILAIERLPRVSANLLEDFLIADSLVQELGKVALPMILSQLAERSIVLGDGEKCQKAIRKFADQIPISALRFLSAWMALNLNQLEVCIEECEKEREPHAAVYTLLGQALLESGRALEAIDALKVAVKLDRKDPVTQVQIIKAYLVSNQPQKAIEPIVYCRELLGYNIEIECFAAMVVIQLGGSMQEFCFDTADRLMQLFEQEPSNLDLLSLTADVIFACNRQDVAEKLFSCADFPKLSRRPDFIGKMAKLLRQAGEKQWYTTSAVLTKHLQQVSGSAVQH